VPQNRKLIEEAVKLVELGITRVRRQEDVVAALEKEGKTLAAMSAAELLTIMKEAQRIRENRLDLMRKTETLAEDIGRLTSLVRPKSV
jgi:hypothetical protein